ncbi:cytochrome c3 family protein [Shewanella schlegeliana]|uniref:Cytochrome c3 family protein n=1 Tax=Shewanella schlegeliana TaxID=190308 RepID=A0ABS1T1D4_9GAMM|nr:cytochrome c3 family protein [Shewanella schlegeliana]MBL4914598.1 cytochrome c3 family protein [Shewanella schlegeliana]MCL1109586.1 cytochrome c3 family protein [Shewanella schlegeliana]GIU29805.1 cytochrome c [Shewanella schlegeliana]
MLKVLGLTVLLSFSGAVLATSVADSHTEMAGCESCHQDGAPSSDMAYENETCISCHGSMKELEGDAHKQHDGVITCSDCHVVHEASPASGSCTSCHQP